LNISNKALFALVCNLHISVKGEMLGEFPKTERPLNITAFLAIFQRSRHQPAPLPTPGAGTSTVTITGTGIGTVTGTDRHRPAWTGTDQHGPAQTSTDRHRPAQERHGPVLFLCFDAFTSKIK
jgi:hypothetical protein